MDESQNAEKSDSRADSGRGGEDIRFVVIDIYRDNWPSSTISSAVLQNFVTLIPAHITPKDLRAGAARAKEWWDRHLQEGNVTGAPPFSAIVGFAVEVARSRGRLAHMTQEQD